MQRWKHIAFPKERQDYPLQSALAEAEEPQPGSAAVSFQQLSHPCSPLRGGLHGPISLEMENAK